jgi:succinylglutamate desuccinylase
METLLSSNIFVTEPRERATSISGSADHLIGAFIGDPGGPTVIVMAGLHGNEPAGVTALRRITRDIADIAEKLRGRAYFVLGNSRALLQNVRYVDADLNRAWTRQNLAKVGRLELISSSEGLELTELDQLLDKILITALDEVFVIDLHSTSADGIPFLTVGDTLRNREFAIKFPATILLGIEEQLDGTFLEHMNNAGAVTLGFEGGQHDSSRAVLNHISLVWLALANAGLLDSKHIPDLDLHKKRLSGGRRAPVIEVRHREAIKPDDEFEMLPGFNNFDHIKRGQAMAENRWGEILAPESGMVLMPLYQKAGNDGFFIVREISSFWLVISGILRRIGIQKIIHFLPGVKRDPSDASKLIINTAVARFFPLQVFHLLGFRRLRWVGSTLEVSRRRHDTSGPFRWKGVAHGR